MYLSRARMQKLPLLLLMMMIIVASATSSSTNVYL